MDRPVNARNRADEEAGARKPATGRRHKKARRRVRPILSLWARIGLLAFAAGVLLFAVVGIVAKAVRPYREAAEQQRQLGQVDALIAETTAQNDALRHRKEYLNTSEGIASEARKLGYVRPGEVPIVVAGAPNPWDTPIAPPAPPAEPTATAKLKTFWHRLTRK